jgi:hypothetical protein
MLHFAIHVGFGTGKRRGWQNMFSVRIFKLLYGILYRRYSIAECFPLLNCHTYACIMWKMLVKKGKQ